MPGGVSRRPFAARSASVIVASGGNKWIALTEETLCKGSKQVESVESAFALRVRVHYTLATAVECTASGLLLLEKELGMLQLSYALEADSSDGGGDGGA